MRDLSGICQPPGVLMPKRCSAQRPTLGSQADCSVLKVLIVHLFTTVLSSGDYQTPNVIAGLKGVWRKSTSPRCFSGVLCVLR